MKNITFTLALFLLGISFLASIYSLIMQMYFATFTFIVLSLLGLGVVLNSKQISFFAVLKKLQVSKKFRWHLVQLRELGGVFVVLLLLYAVAFEFKEKFAFDLTSNKLHSLSPKMQAQIGELSTKIKILYFRSDDSSDFSAEEIVKKIHASGKNSGKISAKIVNLADNYQLARKYGVASTGEMLFFYNEDDHSAVVPEDEELTGTNKSKLAVSIDEKKENGGWQLSHRLVGKDFRPLRIRSASMGVRTYRYHALISSVLHAIENRNSPKTTVVFITGWSEKKVSSMNETGYISFQRALISEGMRWQFFSLADNSNLELLQGENALQKFYGALKTTSLEKKTTTKLGLKPSYGDEIPLHQQARNFFLLVDGSKQFSVDIESFLQGHFSNGGSMALLLEPFSETVVQSKNKIKPIQEQVELKNQHDVGIRKFLKQNGLASSGGQVVDIYSVNPYYSFYSGSSTPSPRYPQLFYSTLHPITASLQSAKLPPFFVGATSFYLENPGQKNFMPLINSSPDAWSEQNYLVEKEKFGIPQFTIGVDSAPGKAVVGLLKNSVGGKTLVVGDGDFLREKFFHLAGNKTLILNALNFIINPNANLALGEKIDDIQPVYFSNKERFFFLLVHVIIFPVVCLVAGLLVAMRRRMRRS